MPKFGARKKTERKYYNKLKEIAAEIDRIVRTYYDPLRPDETALVEMKLEEYANSLNKWAKGQAIKMINEVNFYDVQDFRSISEKMGQSFSKSYMSGKDAVFNLASELVNRQIELMTKLPLDASLRIKKLAQQAQVQGLRHTELIDRIMETGGISRRRAKTIARTEVARANSTLLQARAQSVGITHFIWRTAGDENVRSAHAKLNGKVFAFSNPPVVAGEGSVLPGQTFNCRCIAEPIITEGQE